MTTVAMGLGSAVVVGDLRILAANISLVRNGLQFSPGTTIFVSSLATLTLGASVLGAGVLGDRYGMKRMFVAGACGAVVFGVLGAAAPNVAVLMIARAGMGVAFAFLAGLSLAIMNAVFPPERRAGAIARYLAAVYAFGVLPAMVGGLLAERLGWRSGLLVTPVLAVLVLLITVRYVPETPRSAGRIDIVGLALVATSLLGVSYGVSQLQGGLRPGSVVPILTGLLAGAAFVWWEMRCDEPALDLRIFGSPRFSAVVGAGAVSNLVQGGSAIMVTFYLVVIRDQSTWVFALLSIPATLASALVAVAAGKAATRLGNGAVVVAGLLVLAASMLVRLVFSADTPIALVGAVLALTAMGGAIIQTPQATVMMSSAPSSLGGVVSAVKAAVGSTFNGLGSALFSMVGIILFVRDAGVHLAGSGITPEQAGDVLSATPGSSPLDPERTRWVISEATTSMLHVADALNLILAAVAVVAAVVIGVLFRRGRGAVPAGG